MKYVKRFWIPAVLLIAFIAATVYTTRNTYPVAPDGRAAWVADHLDGLRDTLAADSLDFYLADAIVLADDLDIELWRFEADGSFYDDILVWEQNAEGSYRILYEYCIAQAAIDESEESLMDLSFQQGLYRYEFTVNDDLTLTQPVRSFALLGPLLCVVLVIIYVALTVAALWYRKHRPEKKRPRPE